MQAIFTIFETGGLRTLTFAKVGELPPANFIYEKRWFMQVKDNTWANWQELGGFKKKVPELTTLKADLVTETKTPEVLVYRVGLTQMQSV